jgi:hypothetical protein
LAGKRESVDAARVMSELCSSIRCALVWLFRSRAALQAEILAEGRAVSRDYPFHRIIDVTKRAHPRFSHQPSLRKAQKLITC